jgi:hypothetical protein
VLLHLSEKFDKKANHLEVIRFSFVGAPEGELCKNN